MSAAYTSHESPAYYGFSVRFPKLQVFNPKRLAHLPNKQQNFLISANSFVQRAGIAALSKEGDEAVERMRAGRAVG